MPTGLAWYAVQGIGKGALLTLSPLPPGASLVPNSGQSKALGQSLWHAASKVIHYPTTAKVASAAPNR